MSTQYTAGQYLLDRLKELGAGHMFGVPGDYGFPFLDQIDGDPDIAEAVMTRGHPPIWPFWTVTVARSDD